jgi:hypothetical protein
VIMRKLILAALAALLVAAFAAGPASAIPTGNRGQPSQDCEALLAGGGSEPPGFGTDGFANAQSHYANSQNGNPKAVSQYDVACFQASNNH